MENRLQIALVEDIQEMRYMCRWILQDAFPGAELIEFENGRPAWEFLKGHEIDLVVTDHGMPHMDGIELTRKLRVHGHHLPVIMVSSSLVNIREAYEATGMRVQGASRAYWVNSER
jgi:CheY-like chemotaxis protein